MKKTKDFIEKLSEYLTERLASKRVLSRSMFSDKDKKIEYEIKIRGLYFDFKPFLEELRSKTIKNL